MRLGRKISDSELDGQDEITLLCSVSSCQVCLTTVLTVPSFAVPWGFRWGNSITDLQLVSSAFLKFAFFFFPALKSLTTTLAAYV